MFAENSFLASVALYAEVLNSKGKIIYITANSESGVMGGRSSVVPEPGALTQMGTGLLGLAAQLRRKLRGSPRSLFFFSDPGAETPGVLFCSRSNLRIAA
jgi:PEP-CTERM motif